MGKPGTGRGRAGAEPGEGTRRTFCVCREQLEPAVMERKRCRTNGTWKGPRDLPGWRGHGPTVPFLGTNNPAAAETDWNSIKQFVFNVSVSVWPLNPPWKGGNPQMESLNP